MTLEEKRKRFGNSYFLDKEKFIIFNINNSEHVSILYEYFSLYSKNYVKNIGKSEIEFMLNTYLTRTQLDILIQMFINLNY